MNGGKKIQNLVHYIVIKLIDDEDFMNVETELDGLKNKIDIAAGGVEALERWYRNGKRILGTRLREKALTTKMKIIKLSGESELTIEKVGELSRCKIVLFFPFNMYSKRCKFN